jgi:hypothetical protein
MLGDRGQRVSVSIVDPVPPDGGGPRNVSVFPQQLTDGTSFSFFFELDFRRDSDQGGAWVEDDLGRTHKIHVPAYDPRRRYAEWKARRRFERAIGGKALLMREWKPWRWRRPWRR